MDFNEPETKKVIGVQFSIMVPENPESVCLLKSQHETFDKEVPYIKGLFDDSYGNY